MSEELAINHEEASLFAQMKYEESNLARCYVAYEAEIEALNAQALQLQMDLNFVRDIAADHRTEKESLKHQLSVALDALKDMVESYEHEASSDNPALLNAKSAIQQIQGKGE